LAHSRFFVQAAWQHNHFLHSKLFRKRCALLEASGELAIENLFGSVRKRGRSRNQREHDK
jgi:hypothetical protein